MSQSGTSRRVYARDGGAAFDRVAYFTDAVFAIAMTLLIVSVEAPRLLDRSTIRPR